MPTLAPDNREEHLELPIEELLHRARPLPPHDEMLIEDLSEEEGAAFPAAVDRLAFISFQTAAELWYGAIRRGWGQPRMLRMSAKIERAEVVHRCPELLAVYTQLRADCEAAGHALAQKAHTADRWIAATAIRLGLPLVSNDGIFRGAPGLERDTIAFG